MTNLEKPSAVVLRVFISHTTQDVRDRDRARKLAEGLKARGAEVWIAPESIPSGAEWRQSLTSAILEKCTHFLVIFSAASVQAEWVLKEIALARVRHEQHPDFVILPLKTGRVNNCEASEFLDRFQAIPYIEALGDQLEAVYRALGLRAAIPSDFESYITEAVERFVGREHVFAAAEAFFSRHDRGYFTIAGYPGDGKTSILAQFVLRTGCVCHFNIRAQGVTSTARFLESICAQLIAHYDLPYTGPPADASKDALALERLLKEVASRLAAGERAVVAVDALDEVDACSFPAGANVLCLPKSLPPNIYFVVTFRKNSSPALEVRCPKECYDLTEHTAKCRDDIERYLRATADDMAVGAWIEARQSSVEKFVAVLADKSRNNFMYLRYVLGDIRHGRYQDMTLNGIPTGLEDYYETHWQRMGMTVRPLPEEKIVIIYVLSELLDPVAVSQLAVLAQMSPLAAQLVIEDWKQFLRKLPPTEAPRYSIYHASFQEFLRRAEIVQTAGLTLKEVHRRISQAIAAAQELEPLSL